MATRLPQIQGGQAQVAAVPNIVLPEVQFGQRDVSTAYRAQANYQQTVGSVIDRMSQAVFGVAEGMSQRAGLQFAAENPLSAEQLSAMSRGDLSDINLGSPLNVFNSAVRKARAIEVSGHAEFEARQQLTDLLAKADLGQIDSQSVRDQITALTNGYGESLAQIDPDASYKFRASMATAGNQVIERTAKLDAQRRISTNMVALQNDFDNKIKLVETYLTNDRPINPVSGEPFTADDLINSEVNNFITNATSIVGQQQAIQMGGRLMEAVSAAKVNVITDAVINRDPQIGGNFLTAVGRLQKGNAGIYSEIYDSLTLEQRAALRNEMRSQTVQMEQAQDRARGLAKEGAAREFGNLNFAYYALTDLIETPGPNDDPMQLIEQRNDVARQMTGLAIRYGVASADYVMSLPEKAQKTGGRNFTAEARLKDEVKTGLITKDQFFVRANELGVRPNIAAPMFDLFDGAAARQDTKVDKLGMQLAGTVRGQLNIPARKAELMIEFAETVDDTFTQKMQDWEGGGRVGPPPRKGAVAQEIFDTRRASEAGVQLQAVITKATNDFGPNGTIAKTNLDFNDIEMTYDEDGNPTGLHPDLEAALVAQGVGGQIADIRQYAMIIERQRNRVGGVR